MVAGASTVFHTATRVGPTISAGMASGPAQVLVTGGFVQDPVAPNATRQPPAVGQAVRLYSVADATNSVSPITEAAVAPYMQVGMCGTADGHYRPAGFEAATATFSGNQVLITGGTPSVPTSGCADCDPGDTQTSKLLCALTQASLYNGTPASGAPAFTATAQLPLGRLGHQQTLLPDGTILVTGGLVRPSTTTTQATAEAEVYNPIAGTMDPNDPLTALQSSGAAPACPTL
jgi:hypothetical protein